jgi:hypothetical protein
LRTKPGVEAFRVDENDKAVVDFVQHSLKKDSRGEAIREALKRYAKMCGYTDISANPKIRAITIISSYDDDLRNIANELSHGDTFLSEELRSEMYIYILTTLETSKSINLENAKQKAIDYLSKR